MANKIIVAPVLLPVSLDDIRTHLVAADELDDAFLTGLILAAADDCGNRVRRSIMPQTREETLDAFPVYDGGGFWDGRDFIELPYPPVVEVQSVIYVDSDGAEQTLAPSSYILDNAADDTNAWLAPARGRGWPATAGQINSVRVRYSAGYESAGAIPPSLIQWIKIKVGDLYANRESVNVGNITSPFDYVDKMLTSHRIY